MKKLIVLIALQVFGFAKVSVAQNPICIMDQGKTTLLLPATFLGNTSGTNVYYIAEGYGLKHFDQVIELNGQFFAVAKIGLGNGTTNLSQGFENVKRVDRKIDPEENWLVNPTRLSN